jgi:hypothetical protein
MKSSLTDQPASAIAWFAFDGMALISAAVCIATTVCCWL